RESRQTQEETARPIAERGEELQEKLDALVQELDRMIEGQRRKPSGPWEPRIHLCDGTLARKP
ncbi:MAG: hypothetical protein HYY85_18370, partial [Deltaproteobacteria bacterium]|nr:hypothetical protein [Deltaproteobacteria bacterium]